MSKTIKYILLAILLLLVILFVILFVIRLLSGSDSSTGLGLSTSEKDKQEKCILECTGKFNEEDTLFLECLEKCVERVGIVAVERDEPWCPQNLEEVRQLREWGHKRIGGDIPPWDLMVRSYREGTLCHEYDSPEGKRIREYEGVGKYEFEEDAFKEYAK